MLTVASLHCINIPFGLTEAPLTRELLFGIFFFGFFDMSLVEKETFKIRSALYTGMYCSLVFALLASENSKESDKSAGIECCFSLI